MVPAAIIILVVGALAVGLGYNTYLDLNRRIKALEDEKDPE